MAVGGGGGGTRAGGHILLSDDGRTWRQTYEARGRVNPVLYDDARGRLVAGGPGRTLLVSDDRGGTWRVGATLESKNATHPRRGVYGNGVFLILGNRGGNGPPFWAAATPDGERVAGYTEGLPNTRALAFGDQDGPGGEPGRFVLAGPGGVLRSSVDGLSWEVHDRPAGDNLTSLVWTGRHFLTGTPSALLSSPDGVTWAEEPGRVRGRLLWSDGTRVIATGWPGKMFYSPDRGRTWEPGNPLTANGINAVVRLSE